MSGSLLKRSEQQSILQALSHPKKRVTIIEAPDAADVPLFIQRWGESNGLRLSSVSDLDTEQAMREIVSAVALDRGRLLLIYASEAVSRVVIPVLTSKNFYPLIRARVVLSTEQLNRSLRGLPQLQLIRVFRSREVHRNVHHDTMDAEDGAFDEAKRALRLRASSKNTWSNDGFVQHLVHQNYPSTRHRTATQHMRWVCEMAEFLSDLDLTSSRVTARGMQHGLVCLADMPAPPHGLTGFIRKPEYPMFLPKKPPEDACFHYWDSR